jgi:hypothetical protein
MYSGKLHIMYVNYLTHRTSHQDMKFEDSRAVKIWIAVFKVLIPVLWVVADISDCFASFIFYTEDDINKFSKSLCSCTRLFTIKVLINGIFFCVFQFHNFILCNISQMAFELLSSTV